MLSKVLIVRALTYGFFSTTFIFGGSATPSYSAPDKAAKTRTHISVEKRDGKKWIIGRILINASPETIWLALHEERDHDPDLAYSKVVQNSCSGREYVLEQQFRISALLPPATCTLAMNEIPHKKITYKLIKSNRFKSLEGCWNIIPEESGEGAVLELNSFVDLDLPVPKSFIEGEAAKKMQRRLCFVKNLAEKPLFSMAMP